MATAGTGTIDAAGEDVYDSAHGCTTFAVSVLATSAVRALVNVAGLHAAGEFFPIELGKDMLFRSGQLGIKKVTVKGDGGTASVNYGIVAIA